MTCAGSCTLCGLLRDRQCRCFDRAGRIVDNYHPLLDVPVEYIKSEKFYGNEKHETALVMIAEIRQSLLAAVASGDVDGRELRQFDTDKSRLVRLSEGRVYATRSKMIERDEVRKSKGLPKVESHEITSDQRRDSNLALLARIKAQRG